MYKVILASALVAVAAAIPAAPVAYGPAPVEKLPPQPFAYEYGVADDYSKANFKKAESQDAAGNVAGSFTIALPDGRIQTTTYTADHENGFIAEVTYEGTPVYPEEPKGGYGHAAPVVVAHPVAHHAPVVHHAPLVAHPVAHHVAHHAPLVAHPVVAHPAVLAHHG